VRSLALRPDRKTLVSGSKDGSVFVWDTTSGERASSHVRLPGSLVAWSFATNGQTVFTCDRQGRVARWQGNPLTEERLFDLGTNIARVAFFPHWPIVLARLTDGRVQVWDLQARKFVRELTTLPVGVLPRWLCMAQGSRLLIGDLVNASLQQWDLDTWQRVRTWQGPAQVWTGALSPDERWCVTLGFGGASMIDDLTTGRTTAGKLQIRGSGDVNFSADGKRLAAASDTGFARIWDAATMGEIATLRGFLQGVHSVAFSPDGLRLVTGGTGKEAIVLWDVESHEELLTLEGQGSVFVPTSFSPDGNVIGSMNRPDTQRSILHLWRAPSWAEIEAAEKESRRDDRK
jgi:WD40 repeat protein